MPKRVDRLDEILVEMARDNAEDLLREAFRLTDKPPDLSREEQMMMEGILMGWDALFPGRDPFELAS